LEKKSREERRNHQKGRRKKEWGFTMKLEMEVGGGYWETKKTSFRKGAHNAPQQQYHSKIVHNRKKRWAEYTEKLNRCKRKGL